MSKKNIYKIKWNVFLLILVLLVSGCASKNADSTVTTIPSVEQSAVPTAEGVSDATSDHMHEAADGENILYHDDFTDPATGWSEDKFDNFFIGYHEPEFYHVQVDSPNYKTTVFEPGKDSFGDVSIEVKTFTASAKTAETGDFSFGIAFRRSGDQYYAFTISQRTKKWSVLKSTPNALIVLAEGTDDSIHDPDNVDLLRVEGVGDVFFFYINGNSVGQVTDADYATGEVGLFVQTFDVANAHVHFDEIIVSTLSQSQEVFGGGYHDDFTDPTSGWTEDKFDNFFIGYHEPEFYHIEIESPNYKTTVFEPGKDSYGNVSIVIKAFTASAKTAEVGDYIFGLVFRRSGDQYYAFTVSQRTQKWYVLKSTPNALVVLAEGSDNGIHDPDIVDVLGVDARGSSFSFFINDHLVEQLSDADYATGEVGLFVQTFDVTNVHVHFDELDIKPLDLLVSCTVKAQTLRVRSGPGTSFEASGFLSTGATIEPVGRNEDGDWLKIISSETEEHRWVYNSTGFLSCDEPVSILPISSP